MLAPALWRFADPLDGLASPVDPGSSRFVGADILAPTEPIGVARTFGREDTIVAVGAEAAFRDTIVDGCVRTVHWVRGRRLIGAFLFPGDIVGLESLDRHDMGAEAVTPVRVRRYRREDLDRFAARDPVFSRRMREALTRRLRAAQAHAALLADDSASGRVAGFLLDMADRLGQAGEVRVDLPMRRDDIADYLGLSRTSVCLTMTRLRETGAIALRSSKTVLLERSRLEDLAGVAPPAMALSAA